MLDEVNERRIRTDCNNEEKNKTNRTSAKARSVYYHYHKNGKNEEPEENRIDPSLETLSDERVSPHTNNSRRSQVTDENGYNNKAWPLEDDNDQNDLTGRT